MSLSQLYRVSLKAGTRLAALSPHFRVGRTGACYPAMTARWALPLG
ncbi:hypothetical protein HMPREF0742_00962 [Rothia aeria F0184]|uniref:Uncharacterized protein n=1 Tax=Rothia aeria F0184 TaxID=888019 RepID=U7V4X3_9MICC|nr:hypothetical protein HMPREF0742_00962 [Rothia aeria F0184]